MSGTAQPGAGDAKEAQKGTAGAAAQGAPTVQDQIAKAMEAIKSIAEGDQATSGDAAAPVPNESAPPDIGTSLDMIVGKLSELAARFPAKEQVAQKGLSQFTDERVTALRSAVDSLRGILEQVAPQINGASVGDLEKMVDEKLKPLQDQLGAIAKAVEGARGTSTQVPNDNGAAPVKKTSLWGGTILGPRS